MQFHIVYDNFFSTVATSDGNVQSETWKMIFETSRERVIQEENINQVPTFDDSWLDNNRLR